MRQSVNDNGSLEWPVQDQTWAKSCQSVSSVAGSFCFGRDLGAKYEPIVHAAYDYKRNLIGRGRSFLVILAAHIAREFDIIHPGLCILESVGGTIEIRLALSSRKSERACWLEEG
jgi:hypothetical protein